VALYAIGDIQGCYDEFLQLLDLIGFNADTDRLWLTGDLVNRGPKSLQTLRRVYDMRDNVLTVLGNHDLHLLATAYHHKTPGRKDTLGDLLNASDRHGLLEWLRHQPLIHTDTTLGVTLVHAGIRPQWSIERANTLAREVEQVLVSDQHIAFYQHMYGDKPTLWSESLTTWPRLRFITNVLTRMRYCNQEGRSQLSAKGPPGTQPAGMYPWFELNRENANQPILFGHWSTLPLDADYGKYNVYPLDSGCLWGGQLSALRIDERPFQWTRLQCQQKQNPLAHAE
jgi:bis(5'-nucleosyl)-tetraphosphatase (symmetrical)